MKMLWFLVSVAGLSISTAGFSQVVPSQPPDHSDATSVISPTVISPLPTPNTASPSTSSNPELVLVKVLHFKGYGTVKSFKDKVQELLDGQGSIFEKEMSRGQITFAIKGAGTVDELRSRLQGVDWSSPAHKGPDSLRIEKKSGILEIESL